MTYDHRSILARTGRLTADAAIHPTGAPGPRDGITGPVKTPPLVGADGGLWLDTALASVADPGPHTTSDKETTT